MNAVWNRAILKKVMEDMVDAGPVAAGILDGATVRLIKEDFTPDAELALGDVTLADFTGYATSTAIVWASAALDSDTGLYRVNGDAKIFSCSGATLNNIFGVALATGEGTPRLILSEKFTAPVALPNGGSLVILPTIALGPDDANDSSMLIAS